MISTFSFLFNAGAAAMFSIRSIVVTGLLLATASLAQAETIIYQENFDGSASTPLHGQSPDIDNSGIAGGAKWVTITDDGLPSGTGIRWFADGSMDETYTDNGAASLPFTPQAGQVYTLTLGRNAFTGPDTFWTGFGLSTGLATGTGGGAEFFGNGQPDQVSGRGWMLARVAGTAPSQTFVGFPGVTDGAENWSTPIVDNAGDPIDLRIVLDTTTPTWGLEWLAKKPTDTNFTSLRTASYPSNPGDIGAISISANGGVDGSLSFFTLTTSIPEPSSMLLGAIGIGLLAVRRSRMD